MPFNKEEVNALARIQIAMWVDGESHCEECGQIYKSVDDFIKRKVRAGQPRENYGITFVDDKCFEAYAKKHGLTVEAKQKTEEST